MGLFPSVVGLFLVSFLSFGVLHFAVCIVPTYDYCRVLRIYTCIYNYIYWYPGR